MRSGSSWVYVEPEVSAPGGGAADGSGETWVLFIVDEQKYALRMYEVERIVRAVEVQPLPEAPSHVRGVVNVQGHVLPVIDLRLRFGRAARDLRLEDHFIIARTAELSVVLPVDAALGSVEISAGTRPAREEAQLSCIKKIMPHDQDMVYALDLERVVYGDQSPAQSDLTSAIAGVQTA
jgi:chemotaxis signal transduction protein